MDIGCTLGMTAVSLGLTAMFYGYKIKVDAKNVQLEKNDQDQRNQIGDLKERLQKLEKKMVEEKK